MKKYLPYKKKKTKESNVQKNPPISDPWRKCTWREQEAMSKAAKQDRRPFAQKRKNLFHKPFFFIFISQTKIHFWARATKGQRGDRELYIYTSLCAAACPGFRYRTSFVCFVAGWQAADKLHVTAGISSRVVGPFLKFAAGQNRGIYWIFFFFNNMNLCSVDQLLNISTRSSMSGIRSLVFIKCSSFCWAVMPFPFLGISPNCRFSRSCWSIWSTLYSFSTILAPNSFTKTMHQTISWISPFNDANNGPLLMPTLLPTMRSITPFRSPSARQRFPTICWQMMYSLPARQLEPMGQESLILAITKYLRVRARIVLPVRTSSLSFGARTRVLVRASLQIRWKIVGAGGGRMNIIYRPNIFYIKPPPEPQQNRTTRISSTTPQKGKVTQRKNLLSHTEKIKRNLEHGFLEKKIVFFVLGKRGFKPVILDFHFDLLYDLRLFSSRIIISNNNPRKECACSNLYFLCRQRS